MTYSAKISAYIKENSAKESLHRVFYVGNQDLVYEVYLRDNGGLGIGPSETTMECQLWPSENKCTLQLVLPLSMLACACFCWKSQSSHVVSFEVGGPFLISLWQFMTPTINALQIRTNGWRQGVIARVVVLGMTWMLWRLQTSILSA